MNASPRQKPAESLTILIQTPTRLDDARSLSDAALRKGKRVRLHLSGRGLQLIGHPDFASLCRLVETTICRDCLGRSDHALDPHLAVRLVGHDYQVALLERSTRVVAL